jgi:hypothetical protein
MSVTKAQVSVVPEQASQEFVEATAKPPFLYELSPAHARAVLDGVQAAPIESRGWVVEMIWASLSAASTGAERITDCGTAGSVGLDIMGAQGRGARPSAYAGRPARSASLNSSSSQDLTGPAACSSYDESESADRRSAGDRSAGEGGAGSPAIRSCAAPAIVGVGWPGASQPPAPSDPGVTVSRHRALLISRSTCGPRASG